MERLFEATKLVDISTMKLNRTTEMPLRRSLLVNNVLRKAQEVAYSSEQFMDFSSSDSADLGASRLFATMHAADEPRPVCHPAARNRDTSLATVSNKLLVCRKDPQTNWSDSDGMETDIVNQNSVLSEILSSDEDVSSAPLKSLVADSSVTVGEPEVVSPGKRKSSDRYPWSNSFTADDPVFQFEDHKRFKQSPPREQRSSSVFDLGRTLCLSPANISSAPFIAYMLGNGFDTPSNPLSSAWPDFCTPWSPSTGHRMDYENSPPILAY